MKRKKAKILIFMMFLFVLGITSCRTVYPRPEFANFATSPDLRKVLVDFRKNNIQACSLYQTAIIEIKGKSIASIGFCAFDAENGNIALSLMSTTGMKFIEISEFNGKKKSVFTMPDVASEEKAAERIGEDIKRIFLQPKGNPKDYITTKNSLSFNWINRDLQTELVFGKSQQQGIKGPLLLAKKIYFKGSLESLVYYYDYKRVEGKLFPMRIRYENKKFDYNLTLKTKEVSYGKKPNKR
jgi:hypothetical protein